LGNVVYARRCVAGGFFVSIHIGICAVAARRFAGLVLALEQAVQVHIGPPRLLDDNVWILGQSRVGDLDG
jgi:hypothetical protein